MVDAGPGRHRITDTPLVLSEFHLRQAPNIVSTAYDDREQSASAQLSRKRLPRSAPGRI